VRNHTTGVRKDATRKSGFGSSLISGDLEKLTYLYGGRFDEPDIILLKPDIAL
jgi:hypothetical protein